MDLRPYQATANKEIRDAWAQGAKCVMLVMPTGSGKTVQFCRLLAEHRGPSIAIAHRQELVSQMSLTLARHGVRHRIIAPNKTIRWITSLHVRKVGKSYYDWGAPCIVAGVKTLLRRQDKLRDILPSVTLWVMDEGHHVLRKNEWGKAVDLFPRAKGLAVTATPIRADGKGLGRTASGVVDALVQGPTVRDLIDQGYLTDYVIYGPPTANLDLSRVKIGATGDYVRGQLKTATRNSQIVGDVVKHYLDYASGKRGITFTTDVESAGEIAAGYNAAGVPAEVITAKTPDRIRVDVVDRLASGELRQLVNVDIFGEGFDLPAIEVVSFARPTMSYALYMQQFGRALRPMEGKERAIILDHVGNVTKHLLPDTPKRWDLADRQRRKGADLGVIPVKTCAVCTAVYRALHKACPYCGHAPQPVSRSSIQHVDGDLTEITAEVLARLRGDIARIDKPHGEVKQNMLLAGKGAKIAGAIAKNHRKRSETQKMLRYAISLWGGLQRQLGLEDSASYRKFYHLFGVDVLTAQTLGRPKAERLMQQVYTNILQEQNA